MMLNDGQKDAIKRAISWYYRQNAKNIFVVAGVAGAGKSTVANTLVTTLGLQRYQVLYVAPTGKAASVLRMKGCIANTVHRTFYTVYKINGRVCFAKKKSLPSAIKLVVVDELSMINTKMMEDILSFGIPIIGLGDNAQLPPPLSGMNEYIMNPDVFLDQVMRQKGTSGILDLATMSRLGQPISIGQYNESSVIPISQLTDMEKFDVVLCWKNSTRQELNSLIRKKKNLTSKFPSPGEKLMCLKNNYVHMLDYDEDIPILLANGMGLTSVSEADGTNSSETFFNLAYAPSFLIDQRNPTLAPVSALNNENLVFDTRVHKGPFETYTSGNDFEIGFEDPEDVVYLDYGYACTTHKGQGSEWDNVLVIDEFKGSKDIYNKWLYTSITRAKKSVTVARFL